MEITTPEIIALVKVLHPFVSHLDAVSVSARTHNDSTLLDLNRRLEAELEAGMRALEREESTDVDMSSASVVSKDEDDHDFEIEAEKLDSLPQLKTSEGIVDIDSFANKTRLLVDGSVHLEGITHVKRLGQRFDVQVGGRWHLFYVNRFPREWIRVFPVCQIARITK